MNEHLVERFGHGPPGRSRPRQQQQQRQRHFNEDTISKDQVEVTFLPPRLNRMILQYEDDHRSTSSPGWLGIPEIPEAAELGSDRPRDLPFNLCEGAWSTKGETTVAV
jgi:hypothetical protein